MSNADYMLAEFKGTYCTPHPGGLRDQVILANFHCQVVMPKEFLHAPGLNGPFAVHYVNFLKTSYPNMIRLYRFELVQAVELDGKQIQNPKALSQQGLLEYIAVRKLPINVSLYNTTQLRDEIILYEVDAKGQQHLQKTLEQRKGGAIAIANELAAIQNLVRVLPVNNPAVAQQSPAVPAVPIALPEPTPAAEPKPLFAPPLLTVEEQLAQMAAAQAEMPELGAVVETDLEAHTPIKSKAGARK